jgi:uncharacterized membrane protein HdeD (DUF308 family)
LFWPSATLALLLTLVGVFCIIDGLTGLLGVFRTSGGGPALIQPLVSLAVGAVLLFWPGATVKTLLVVFGAWLLFVGVSQIISARREVLVGGDRSVMTTIGGLTAAIGLVLIVWPGTGVVAISWVIAIAALAVAALLIFLALRLKRVKERMDSRHEGMGQADL